MLGVGFSDAEVADRAGIPDCSEANRPNVGRSTTRVPMSLPMPDDPNRNARWCRLIAEELHRSGVRAAVLCPGSRNSALVFALAAVFGDAAISQVDERSAAFIALGLVRSTGEPALVCVTSGSALANCLPALTEADAAGLPLIVVSGDRPWELHGCGAPQTMRQRGILAAFVRTELALGEPSDEEPALRALRSQVSRLAQSHHGPTHLNVPLRDPLPPIADPTWQPPEISELVRDGRTDGQAWTPIHRPHPAAPLPDLRPGMRGVVLAGCATDPHRVQVTTATLARLGWPIVADAPSHWRQTGLPVITTADALVQGRAKDWAPEVILQLGPPPLTRALSEWTARQTCPRYVITAHEQNQDFLASASAQVIGGDALWLEQVASAAGPGDLAWRRQWAFAESAAETAWLGWYGSAAWGEDLVTAVAVNHQGFEFLHLASSMPVRLANLHLRAGARRCVHSNRGVNGIDGTLGTMIGLARGHGQRGLLLTGDLAFLHDLPALAGIGLAPAGGAIVLLNNGGGGIFDFLPVGQVPGSERWIRTSHGLRFADAARLFGLVYQEVRDRAGLATALDAAAGDAGRWHLIEADLRGLDHVAQHRILVSRLAGNG